MLRKFTELLAGLFLLVLAIAPVSSAESERIEVAPGVYFQSADGLTSSRPEARQIPAARSGRIVGGTETEITQWPWQTAIALSPSFFSGNGFDRQICGGTLLTPTFVVSAAHCFYDNGSGGFTPPAWYSVITGRTRLSTSAGQEINFDTYFYFVDGSGNPLYNPNDSDWDIVLIRLAAPSVSPTIKLSGPDERATWAAGRTAFITGWGTTAEGGVPQDALRFGQVAIVDDLICADRYAGVSPIYPDTMVCAGRDGGGVDTCQGDSGGPLVVPIASGGFRLVGDTSFGIGCARAEFPGVYGRLADDPFRSSIRNLVFSQTGIDVVGTGATPPGPPPPPPPPPPATTITSGPKKVTTAKKARFTFVASAPVSTFLCKLDLRPERPCLSPFKVGVKLGKHKVRITAVNHFNVRGPATMRRWRVVEGKP